MKQLQSFTDGYINLPVQQLDEGSIQFDAEQAAIGLGISQIAKSGNEVVRWERVNKYLSSPKVGMQISKGDFITEPQFYELAIKANSKKAKRFQYWVTHDVLPSIRKNGVYMTDQTAYDITHDKDALGDLLLQAGNQLKKKDLVIQEMKPKALFADSVATSKTTILVGDLAKILKGNGVDTGQNRLFEELRNTGFLISRKGASYNMPTQLAMDMGLFVVKETAIQHSDGHVTVNKTPKVTGKGQQYFINKYLQDNQTA
ncbi:phage antirepressor KilAC domain-containing protein [Lactiplantibacillus plantarum]|uniref:phage antirepressor KilAC domain-containing protein n=1 Tax=Lactiplantibacillus plantarum TaxID=1590 RepID=UPI0030EDD9D5